LQPAVLATRPAPAVLFGAEREAGGACRLLPPALGFGQLLPAEGRGVRLLPGTAWPAPSRPAERAGNPADRQGRARAGGPAAKPPSDAGVRARGPARPDHRRASPSPDRIPGDRGVQG